MNDNNIEQNIQNKVLEKIRGHKVAMRPKIYFVSRLILTILFTFLALIVSVFVISFVFFSIHESGEQFLLGFGNNGITTFLSLFPWQFFLLDISILLVLEWLLQGFKLAYRISFLVVFLAIFVTSTFLGLLVNFTPIHGILLDQADKGILPVVGEIYESIHDSHADKGIFRGTIMSINNNEIVLRHDDKDQDADDGTWTIVLPSNYPPLMVGDQVYVFAYPPSSTGVITARGIQKLQKRSNLK